MRRLLVTLVMALTLAAPAAAHGVRGPHRFPLHPPVQCVLDGSGRPVSVTVTPPKVRMMARWRHTRRFNSQLVGFSAQVLGRVGSDWQVVATSETSYTYVPRRHPRRWTTVEPLAPIAVPAGYPSYLVRLTLQWFKPKRILPGRKHPVATVSAQVRKVPHRYATNGVVGNACGTPL